MFGIRVYKPFYKKVGVKYIYENIFNYFKSSYPENNKNKQDLEKNKINLIVKIINEKIIALKRKSKIDFYTPKFFQFRKVKK